MRVSVPVLASKGLACLSLLLFLVGCGKAPVSLRMDAAGVASSVEADLVAVAIPAAARPSASPAAVVPAVDLYSDMAAQGEGSGRLLVAADFKDHAKLVPVTGNPRATGALPPAFREDSAWAKVWVDYTPQLDDLGGGLSWVRATVTRHESGAAQLKAPLSAITDPADFRLSLIAASPTASVMTVKIMDAGPPYKTHWMKAVGLGSDRQAYVFDFRLGPLPQNLALIASLGQAGTFDLFGLSLGIRSAADIRQEIDRRYPDGGPANLLSTSHFPLGLPGGWTVGVNHSLEKDVTVASCLDMDTGRGTVPLHLATRSGRGEIALSSAPFLVPVAYRPHVFSAYLQGRCQGTLSILGDGVELGKVDIDIDSPASFRRIEIPFQPVLQGHFHIVRGTLKGDFLLDALMVSPGETVLPFQFRQGAEITLAHDGLRSNTCFVDDLAGERLRYEVRGSWPQGAKLAFRLYNAYGDVGGLPDVDLPDVGQGPAVGELPVLPTHPGRILGAQRLEASLVDGDGRLLGPAQEIVYHLLPRPRHWGKDAPERSPFGIHCNVYEPHLYAAKSLGVNWLRVHGPNGFLTYWSAAEKQPGEFTFQDDYVGIVRRHHLRILGILTECPGWARITRPTGGAWLDNWWQPRDFGEFGTYARTMTRHHAGVIDHWEIWNEPWGGFWFREWDGSRQGAERWSRGPDPLGDYLRLSRIAFAAVKEGNPKAFILGINGTTWGGGRGGDWFGKMLAAGGLDTCDAPSFHVYHNDSDFFGCVTRSDSFWSKQLEANILAPLRAVPTARARAPWMTEGKSSEQVRDSALYRHTVLFHTDGLQVVRDHAALLPLYHARLFSVGVDKVFLYAMEATGFKPVTGVDWSVLTTKSGELNVSADAYAAMTWLLEDMRFAKRLDLAGGRHAFLCVSHPDASGSRTVAMLTAEPAHEPLVLRQLPTGATGFDLFGNPLADGAVVTDRVAYVVLPDHGVAAMEAFLVAAHLEP